MSKKQVVLMKALLSIKPRYVEEIKKGNKKYEFRKVGFRRKDDLTKIYIYSTAPIKKIVGCFNFDSIIEDHPKVLWENFKDYSGIEEKDFFNYFENKKSGVAIKITDLEIFEEPIDPTVIIPNFVPPQSFYYIEENWTEIYFSK